MHDNRCSHKAEDFLGVSLVVVLVHHLNYRNRQVKESENVEQKQQDSLALVALLTDYVSEKVVSHEDGTQAVQGTDAH